MDMSKRELVSYHEDTELRLGLSRDAAEVEQSFRVNKRRERSDTIDPPTKVQAIGWPPVKSFRKNSIKATKSSETKGTSVYVKVSMDGTPYLRKIDLKSYRSYEQLLEVLEDMFKLKYEKQGNRSMIDNNGSLYEPTYEDKDGDWMLVGDVPWDMFISSCKRLRIMKGSKSRAKIVV